MAIKILHYSRAVAPSWERPFGHLLARHEFGVRCLWNLSYDHNLGFLLLQWMPTMEEHKEGRSQMSRMTTQAKKRTWFISPRKKEDRKSESPAGWLPYDANSDYSNKPKIKEDRVWCCHCNQWDETSACDHCTAVTSITSKYHLQRLKVTC